MTKLRESYAFTLLMVALSAAVSLVGGVGIEKVSEQIVLITPLLIALPSLGNLVGDYAAVIAAHAGDPAERTRSRLELLKAIAVVLTCSVLSLVTLTLLLSVLRGFTLDAAFVMKFVSFIFVACFMAVAIMFILAITLEALLRKRRLNPDDVLIPVVTALADIFMLLMVTLAVSTIF